MSQSFSLHIPPGPVALVGMDVIAAGQDGLTGYEGVFYQGGGQQRLPEGLQLAFRPVEQAVLGIPQATLSTLALEDQLLLRVSARALLDAGVQPDRQSSPRVIFCYSCGQGLAIQVAQAAGLPKPAVTASAQRDFPFAVRSVDHSESPHPLAAGLLLALEALAAGEADLALLGGVALLADFEGFPQLAAALRSTGASTLGLDENAPGWSFGEGAVGVVLARTGSGRRAYAHLDGLGWAPRDLPGLSRNLFPTLLSADTVAQAGRQAFDAAECAPQAVGALELLASGSAPLDGSELAGLAQVYGLGEGVLRTALGSGVAGAGYLFNAAGLLGLARAALGLARRVLPAAPGWSGPKKGEWLAGTPFYVNGELRSWFPPAGSTRRAALDTLGRDGSCLHLLLREASANAVEPRSRFLVSQPARLFVLAGAEPVELVRDLEALRGAPGDLPGLAQRAYQQARQRAQAPLALGLVAASREELQREIDFALRDLPTAFAQGRPWQTPAGSYGTPQPVGPAGEVAFVYPGAFNSYLGLGRDLFQLFPQLYPRAEALTTRLGEMLHEQHLYPRSQRALSREVVATLETQLTADPIAMLTTGSLIAVLYTMIMRDLFQVRASAAFGYSLGEIAMLFGTGVWQAADTTSAALRESPLFQTRLAGPQNAVREAWGLPPVQPGAGGEALWANYFLMADPQRVREALQGESQAYLTHVNTPRQVVIGGAPAACQRVIERLHCTSLRAPFDFALHCAAIRSELPAMARLHSWPLSPVDAPRLYSAANDAPLPMEREVIAGRIAAMLCSSLDFPRLVRQVYEEGARVFIELGANANCSKWIEETLKGSPFLSVAINRKGAEDLTSILRLLARLASHRVSMDLSPLFPLEGGV